MTLDSNQDLCSWGILNHRILQDFLCFDIKGSVTVRGEGMFMRFFEKSYKV